jgi:hypothetical protein
MSIQGTVHKSVKVTLDICKLLQIELVFRTWIKLHIWISANNRPCCIRSWLFDRLDQWGQVAQGLTSHSNLHAYQRQPQVRFFLPMPTQKPQMVFSTTDFWGKDSELSLVLSIFLQVMRNCGLKSYVSTICSRWNHLCTTMLLTILISPPTCKNLF